MESKNKERELIRDLSNGDHKAFTKLYELYAQQAYGTALNYTKDIELAEEITQDVFVKVFKNISTFKGQSSLSTWIYRITVNTSINQIKRKNNLRSKKNEISEDNQIDFNHPGVLLENKENAATLFRVMESLPDRQKTVFILSYIDGLPRQEVADIMETTLKSVESLLQRAKQNMRVQLIKIYPNRRK